MGVRIKGLSELRDRIKGATRVMSKRRLQEEGRAVREFARSISPVLSGDFKRGWRFRTTGRALLEVYNDVPYSPWVHPKADPTTTQSRVRAFAKQRAPQLATDLANISADYIRRFRSS